MTARAALGICLCVAAWLCAAVPAHAQGAAASDSTTAAGRVPPRLSFPPLSATGRGPSRPTPMSRSDSLRAARGELVAPEPALLAGPDLAAVLARDAPWWLTGAAVPDGWRGVAFPGTSARATHTEWAGVRWRDPLGGGVDASAFAAWPWNVDATGEEVRATPTLRPSVPARTLLGYAVGSDGATDLRVAVAGRVFGDADLTGWVTARDADRLADGGARAEDRAEALQIGRPRGADQRVSLSLVSLPALRERALTVDRGDGAGAVGVQTLTQRRPRVLEAAWSRRRAESESLRVMASWSADRTEVSGVLDGVAWTETARGGAQRLAVRGAGGRDGVWWADGELRRETLTYRSIAPVGKTSGSTVVLADTSRQRYAADVTAGVRRAAGGAGVLRLGVRVSVPGERAAFVAPVVAFDGGDPAGGVSWHAALDAVTAAPSLLEPVRRVSESFSAAGDAGAQGGLPVERGTVTRAGLAVAGARGRLRVEGFETRDAGFAVRDAAPFDADLAVRRASRRLTMRGALGAADCTLAPRWTAALRGTWIASSESVRLEAERPRWTGSGVTNWTGRCLGVDCGLSTSLVLTSRTPSVVAANVVPASAVWDASLALHVQGAWCVVRGENLAGRALGPVSAPFTTTPRVMAGVLLSLRD